MLNDTTLLDVRAENPEHPSVVAAWAGAERLRTAAYARLAGAYDTILDNATKLSMPMGRDERHAPAQFINDVDTAFKGTAHHEPLVARARALHERFEAEYAAIIKARHELWDRLMTDGDATWPSIVESTGADPDIDPTAEDSHGKTVLLRGVYNRAGWEWGGFSFAVARDDIPIAGEYERNVLAALEHAWYELQFSNAVTTDGPAVTDRFEWDVIAVVQGKGKVTQRTKIVRRDQYGQELGTEEQWLPVDGVILKIVGLHAGPVTVGPDHDWAPSAT
jgi:hypothetical protein